MLPKKLFAVDQRPLETGALQVTRAVVIAVDAEAALGQVQACVDEANKLARGFGKPCPVFVRSQARALMLADSVVTTPANASHGVICVESNGAAPADRRTTFIERPARP
jgi:hypothetical protein